MTAKPLEVMIVDDQACMAHMMEMLLDKHLSNLSVRLFWSHSAGKQAIEAIDGGYRPGFAMLDIRLNGINGVDVYRKLRAADEKVPIMFLTGLDESQADFKEAVSTAGKSNVIIKGQISFFRDIIDKYPIFQPYLRCGNTCEIQCGRRGAV